jgi:ABC-type uncharacterized transport system permease subunit
MDFWVDALAAGVVLGTPLAYAALGELVAERGGVINLGVEGMMLVGAVVGFIVSTSSGRVVAGFAAAAAAGAGLALLHAFMCVSLRVNQIVMGLTLTILGTGLSAFIGADYGRTPAGSSVHDVNIPGLESIPGLGEILFQQDVFVYAVPFVTALVALFLFRSRFGLSLRAIGESPAAADAAGVPVYRYQYFAVLFGGAMAGIGGAYFSIVFAQAWSDNLTAGRGWIAVALVIFASWRPVLLLPGALLFGFIDALNFQLQAEGVAISSSILSMMPYVFTLVVLTAVWVRQRNRQWGMPAAIGVPYEREART